MNRAAIVLALLAPALAAADPGPSRLYVRLGVAHVHPLSSSRELELSDVDGPASLAIQNGPIAGSGTSVSSATIPAASLSHASRGHWNSKRRGAMVSAVSVERPVMTTLAPLPSASTIGAAPM